MNDIYEWARNEVKFACENATDDYSIMCYLSALKAFKSLCEDGHSEDSIETTRKILNRLIDGYLLTPIEDTKDIWEFIREGRCGEKKFQCTRMSSLFKTVYADAPLYWWKEADTYKVGTDRNSCSTMHTVMAKEFTDSDFAFPSKNSTASDLIDTLNMYRTAYLRELDPKTKRAIWDFVIALLPNAYIQRSTMVLNYQVLSTMYHQRKDHKLSEWREFCEWIKTLPMSDLITGE